MNTIETKFDEVVITTSNIEEMKGKYVAERLFQKFILKIQRNSCN